MGAMNLRCKVFRADSAGDLEEAINRFLEEEMVRLAPVQFEEISQSEGPGGVTVVLWYSRVVESEAMLDDETEDAEFDDLDEVDSKELA